MATIILENARVRVGLLQVPCLVFSHELAGHHVFDHMPATGSLPRSSAPSRYRLRCVVRRSVLPRERFSPLARTGRAEEVVTCPLCGRRADLAAIGRRQV